MAPPCGFAHKNCHVIIPAKSRFQHSLLVPGATLIHLDEEKTVTVHPGDLLLPLDVAPGQNVAAPPAPAGTRKAHGQGRRARARRPGSLAAAARSLGEEKRVEC